MHPSHLFRETSDRHLTLWLDPNASMAEIQRFVGIVEVFGAQGGVDPLRFRMTPKKGLKAALFQQANVTVVRGLPHPRFHHPITGVSVLRYSEALSIAKKLQGIPEGEKLTLKNIFRVSNTKALQAAGGAPTPN